MIRAVFNRDFSGFSLDGHAGYAEEGSDIVCAAVSSMANLVCNAAEAFGADAEITEGTDDAYLSYHLLSENEQAVRLLSVFYNELKELETLYPDYIRVKKNTK